MRYPPALLTRIVSDTTAILKPCCDVSGALTFLLEALTYLAQLLRTVKYRTLV